MNRLARVAAAIFSVLVLSVACGRAADEAEEVEDAVQSPVEKVTDTEALGDGEVSFAEPTDGASVANPVKVRMEATNFTVEPAGQVREGAGHFHIMIDTECAPPGEVIPNDDSHRHYGQGQKDADLTLQPGEHELCLQFADGAHKALDATDTINIRVTG